MRLRTLACFLLVAAALAPTASANTVSFQLLPNSGSVQWSLQVPADGQVSFDATVHGYYNGLSLSIGTGSCNPASLGSGAAVSGPAHLHVDCGLVPLGWYTLKFSGSGAGGGTLTANGANILI